MNTSSLLQNWIITIVTVFISFSGFVLALMYTQTTPGRIANPSIGAIYYFIGSLSLIFYFFLTWRKNKAMEEKLLEGKNGNSILVVRESVSDKILKWGVAVFAIFFVVCSIVMALLCIYSLPDKTVQPQIGLSYFISGVLVLVVLVFVVWKNWVTNKS